MNRWEIGSMVSRSSLTPCCVGKYWTIKIYLTIKLSCWNLFSLNIKLKTYPVFLSWNDSRGLQIHLMTSSVMTTPAKAASVKGPGHPLAVGRVASTTPEFKAITKWVQIIRALQNKTQELQRKSRSLLQQSGASCVNYVSVLITPTPSLLRRVTPCTNHSFTCALCLFVTDLPLQWASEICHGGCGTLTSAIDEMSS